MPELHSFDTRAAKVDDLIVDTRQHTVMKVVRITPAGAGATSYSDGPTVHARVLLSDGATTQFTHDIWDRSMSFPASRYRKATAADLGDLGDLGRSLLLREAGR